MSASCCFSVVGRATAPESGAYPLTRMRPERGAGLWVFLRHARCEKQVCAHTPAPGVVRTNLPSPREGRLAPRLGTHPQPAALRPLPFPWSFCDLPATPSIITPCQPTFEPAAAANCGTQPADPRAISATSARAKPGGKRNSFLSQPPNIRARSAALVRSKDTNTSSTGRRGNAAPPQRILPTTWSAKRRNAGGTWTKLRAKEYPSQ